MWRRWRGRTCRADQGKPGRRYILGGENLTLKQILDKMSAITGIPSPTVEIPFAVAATYAFFEEWITGRIRGKEPRATLEEVRMGRKKMFAVKRARATGAGLPHFAGLPGDARGDRVVPRERVCAQARGLMTRIAIIAAMPGELKPLVRGWPHSTRYGVHLWAQRNEEEEWIAACAGAGQAAATRAFAAIEDGGPIDLVFSIGWAGALIPSAAAGTAHNMAGTIDMLTGDRFRCDAGAGELWLVTSPRVADEAEKLRLAEAYGAGLVDMEAAAVARLAAMRGIPFYCIKGVSDGLNDHLPDFNRFITAQGGVPAGAICSFCASAAQYWPGLMRMGENSRKASQSIAESLLEFLRDVSMNEVASDK